MRFQSLNGDETQLPPWPPLAYLSLLPSPSGSSNVPVRRLRNAHGEKPCERLASRGAWPVRTPTMVIAGTKRTPGWGDRALTALLSVRERGRALGV